MLSAPSLKDYKSIICSSNCLIYSVLTTFLYPNQYFILINKQSLSFRSIIHEYCHQYYYCIAYDVNRWVFDLNSIQNKHANQSSTNRHRNESSLKYSIWFRMELEQLLIELNFGSLRYRYRLHMSAKCFFLTRSESCVIHGSLSACLCHVATD